MIDDIPALIERLLCWPLMSSRQRQLSDNTICKDIETAAAALERMTRENEELRVENAKAFARQIATEDELASRAQDVAKLEASRDDYWKVWRATMAERDAIRAKIIEECAHLAVIAAYFEGKHEAKIALTNIAAAIRALNQPPEAEGKEE